MKNIFHIVRFIRFLLNKDASYYKSNEAITDALHHAQLTLFMERIGNPAKYQPGHPIAPVSYQVTKKVAGDVQVFLKEKEYTPTTGEIVLPEDFVYPTSLRISKAGAEIEVLDDDKIAKRFFSQVKPITSDYPVAEILANGYRIYPNTLKTAYLKYLSLPEKPVYATDLAGDDEVYNDAASVGLQWPEITHNEIINRTLVLLGINVKDVMVENYANYQKQQGA